MSLEERLRDAIKRGFLHLSLDRHFKTGKWMAAYRNTDSHQIIYVEHDDPIEAVMLALKKFNGKTASPEESSPVAVKAKKSLRRKDDLI